MSTHDSTQEERKATSQPEQVAGTEHVEVLVDDFFIEEYQVPLTLPPEPDAGLTRVRRSKSKIVAALLSLFGVAASAFAFHHRRRGSKLRRAMAKLHLA